MKNIIEQNHGETSQSDYQKRLENEIDEVSKRRDNLTHDIEPEHFGSLGGQLTILKRELNYIKTHKITNDEKLEKV